MLPGESFGNPFAAAAQPPVHSLSWIILALVVFAIVMPLVYLVSSGRRPRP